jgi:hypothetical protein
VIVARHGDTAWTTTPLIRTARPPLKSLGLTVAGFCVAVWLIGLAVQPRLDSVTLAMSTVIAAGHRRVGEAGRYRPLP